MGRNMQQVRTDLFNVGNNRNKVSLNIISNNDVKEVNIDGKKLLVIYVRRQGNRILLPKNKLCSEFIGPASHFEFASHAGFLGV